MGVGVGLPFYENRAASHLWGFDFRHARLASFVSAELLFGSGKSGLRAGGISSGPGQSGAGISGLGDMG